MSLSTRKITVTGVLGSITVVLGLLPFGGFIPVPTPAGSATTMHIPAILAGIIEGPFAGGIVGAIFGAFSFYQAQTSANPVAKMMFTNPVIAFVPRIAIGVVAYYVYRLTRGKKGLYVLAAVLGLTLAHTGYFALGGFKSSIRWIFAVLLALLGSGFVILINQKSSNPGPALGAVAGSLINTVGVLGASVLFGYLPFSAAVAVAIMHGIPEALVALILTELVYRSVSRFIQDQK